MEAGRARHATGRNWRLRTGAPGAVGARGMAHPRSAMSLVNVAYSDVLTWSDPEPCGHWKAQALIPHAYPKIRWNWGCAVANRQTLDGLRTESRVSRAFSQAFPEAQGSVSRSQTSPRRWPTFERTIISARSPYDRYNSGNDGARSPRRRSAARRCSSATRWQAASVVMAA